MGQQHSSGSVLAAFVQATPEADRLDAVATAYLETLPPKHRDALVAYTGDLSHVVNPWLTGTDAEPLTPDEQRLVRKHVVSLVAAVALSPGLSRQPAGTRIGVFSGFPASAVSNDPDFGWSAADPRALQVGDAVGWFRNRLVSASLSLAVARAFVRGDTCCIFRLWLVPPMAALPVWRISQFPDELEVLLPPGYQWRVAERDDTATPVVITLACINPDAMTDPGTVRRLLLELQKAAAVGATRRSGEIVGPWHTA